MCSQLIRFLLAGLNSLQGHAVSLNVQRFDKNAANTHHTQHSKLTTMPVFKYFSRQFTLISIWQHSQEVTIYMYNFP